MTPQEVFNAFAEILNPTDLMVMAFKYEGFAKIPSNLLQKFIETAAEENLKISKIVPVYMAGYCLEIDDCAINVTHYMVYK